MGAYHTSTERIPQTYTYRRHIRNTAEALTSRTQIDSIGISIFADGFCVLGDQLEKPRSEENKLDHSDHRLLLNIFQNPETPKLEDGYFNKHKNKQQQQNKHIIFKGWEPVGKGEAQDFQASAEEGAFRVKNRPEAEVAIRTAGSNIAYTALSSRKLQN